jgi:phosphate transport system permease protein
MSLEFGEDPRLHGRRQREAVALWVLRGCAVLCLAALAVLIGRMLWAGVPHMTAGFWTSNYSPAALRFGIGEAGILDAVVSSLIVLLMTMLVAVPIGVATGIYIHEYAARGRFTGILRASISNLAGVPSVVYGLLGLAIFVRVMGLGPTMLAASLTLAVLILPIIIVATEEALKTVPRTIRDASLALGATRWQTIRHHVFPYSLPGILTGNILALSRAAGETAPLLVLGIPVFTTILGYGPLDLGTPLQVRVYFLASDASDAARNLALASIVVLLLATLLLNLAAILLRNRLMKRIRW